MGGGVNLFPLLPAHRLHLVITLSTSMFSSNGFESLVVTQPRVFVQRTSCSQPPHQLTGYNRLTGGYAELGSMSKHYHGAWYPNNILSITHILAGLPEAKMSYYTTGKYVSKEQGRDVKHYLTKMQSLDYPAIIFSRLPRTDASTLNLRSPSQAVSYFSNDLPVDR